ncbi:hypothetical protein PLIIFM63780_010524 [Purpureocillium lilacinum]|nr:hypothetical protein PLIIFM63780_010524 [Purpureocillium lilacinum]
MESMQDVWYTRRRPRRLDSQEDQIYPETSVLQEYKTALLSQEKAEGDLDFFQGAPGELIASFRGDSIEVRITPAPCAVTLTDIPRSRSLWKLATKTLMATLALDNSQTRNTDIPLACLLLETVGVLSSDLTIWHLTNNIHGCAEAIFKRIWNNAVDPASGRSPAAKDRTNMVSFVVLIDTLRSLHMGMAASSISAFADITLEAPHHSLSGLLSQTLFAGPQTEWPAFSQDNALLTILLILSHTLIWVREMSPLAPSAETVSPQGRSNVDAETQKCRIRIERALDKWEGQYSRGALPETRALFYFCRMHLRAPHLHLVAVYAQYEPLATLSPIPLEKVSSIVEADTSTLDEAAHFAWLVLEQVPDAADVTALWLPIILQ